MCVQDKSELRAYFLERQRCLWIGGVLPLHQQQSETAAGCPVSLLRQRDSPDPTLVGDWGQSRTQDFNPAVPENCADPLCRAELLLLPKSCV